MPYTWTQLTRQLEDRLAESYARLHKHGAYQAEAANPNPFEARLIAIYNYAERLCDELAAQTLNTDNAPASINCALAIYAEFLSYKPFDCGVLVYFLMQVAIIKDHVIILQNLKSVQDFLKFELKGTLPGGSFIQESIPLKNLQVSQLRFQTQDLLSLSCFYGSKGALGELLRATALEPLAIARLVNYILALEQGQNAQHYTFRASRMPEKHFLERFALRTPNRKLGESLKLFLREPRYVTNDQHLACCALLLHSINEARLPSLFAELLTREGSDLGQKLSNLKLLGKVPDKDSIRRVFLQKHLDFMALHEPQLERIPQFSARLLRENQKESELETAVPVHKPLITS